MVTFKPLKQARENGAILLNFRCLSPKLDHLIPYVNESKSLRRVSGQDPLICHKFRSSKRWWHFNPLTTLGKMEQYAQFMLFQCKIDHLIPYVNESKWLRSVSGQDPLDCHRFRSSQRWWHFSPLSRLVKNRAILLNFRCLSPNLTTLYLM